MNRVDDTSDAFANFFCLARRSPTGMMMHRLLRGEMLMAAEDNTAAPKRVPGRKPGPDEREEMLRIWGHVDDDGRKMMLFFSRQLAREQGLVPADAPLIITDRMF